MLLWQWLPFIEYVEYRQISPLDNVPNSDFSCIAKVGRMIGCYKLHDLYLQSTIA